MPLSLICKLKRNPFFNVGGIKIKNCIAHPTTRATARPVIPKYFSNENKYNIHTRLDTILITAGILYSPFGIVLNPMICALAMSLSSICVVLNTLRITKIKKGLASVPFLFTLHIEL